MISNIMAEFLWPFFPYGETFDAFMGSQAEEEFEPEAFNRYGAWFKNLKEEGDPIIAALCNLQSDMTTIARTTDENMNDVTLRVTSLEDLVVNCPSWMSSLSTSIWSTLEEHVLKSSTDTATFRDTVQGFKFSTIITNSRHG